MSEEEGLTAVQLLYKLWGGNIPTEDQAKLYMTPLEDYEGYILRRVYRVLKKNIYYAMGYRVPAAEREKILPDHWSFLHIHPPSDIAAGGGHEFHGLRFFENKPKPKKTSKTEAEYLVELIELMQAERFKTRTTLKDDAINRGVVSGKGFDRCWEKARADPTTSSSWGNTGPMPDK